METLTSFKEANADAISNGKSIYISLAEEVGILPMEALKWLPSLLSSPWVEPNHFLADLGKDDILALIEARSHFGLPPLE
jgi:hypothetical protein